MKITIGIVYGFMIAFLCGCRNGNDDCVTYAQQKKYEEAFTCLDKALEQSPNDRDLHINRAQVNYQTGKYREALGDLDAAGQVKPLQSDELDMKANSLFKLGFADSALAYFFVVYSQNNNYPHINYNLAVIYFEKEDFENALKYINREISLSPGCDSCYYMQGMSLFELKQYEQSIQAYADAIKINPGQNEYLKKRAAAYGAVANYTAEINDCNAALSLDSNYSDAYLLRAFAYHRLHEEEKACSDYAKLKSLSPDDAKKYGEVFICK